MFADTQLYPRIFNSGARGIQDYARNVYALLREDTRARQSNDSDCI